MMALRRKGRETRTSNRLVPEVLFSDGSVSEAPVIAGKIAVIDALQGEAGRSDRIGLGGHGERERTAGAAPACVRPSVETVQVGDGAMLEKPDMGNGPLAVVRQAKPVRGLGCAPARERDVLLGHRGVPSMLASIGADRFFQVGPGGLVIDADDAKTPTLPSPRGRGR